MSPGAEGGCSAALKAFEGALKRFLPPCADEVPKRMCTAHSTRDPGGELLREALGISVNRGDPPSLALSISKVGS